MDGRQVVERLESYLGQCPTKNTTSDEVLFHCPKCNHRKPKLAINVQKGVYHCWVCDFRGVNLNLMLRRLGHDVVTKINVNKRQTLEDIKRFLGEDGNSKDVEDWVAIPKNYPRLYLRRFDQFYSKGWNYLKNRGFTEDDLLKYSIRYSLKDQRVLFPSYNLKFNCNYFVSRAISDDAFIRYVNSIKPKTEVIFNEHLVDWDNTIYLVEGVFDAILSRKNSIPLLGSQLSKNSSLFHNILYYDPEIILCLDQDAEDKQVKLATLLSDNGIRVKHFRFDNESNKDVADLGEKFIEYGSIEDHSFKHTILSKLKYGKGKLCNPSIG